MEWVIFLAVLVQINCISSQPLTNENVRESRQLKLDECCPCPTAGLLKDNHVLDTNVVPSDCPCRAADSDTASSIFTPTLKAVQSFVRPNKDEQKPLLNPEVGLASSVLETLREATDQEYEEALARDAARSALQAMDSVEVEGMPVSARTNVFNDVLSPRNSEAMDITSEASHNEETRCIHPTLSRISEFGHFEMQPQINFLKDFLFSKPSYLSKNIFDMDNSPSNIQENILPTKNRFLDDIKIKSNLLKSKLLTNNKGLLHRMVTDKSFDETYYNKPHKKNTDWKLVTPLDNLKSSKLFDSNRPQLIAENINISKNKAQNNKKVLIPLRKPQQSNKFSTDEVLSSETNNFPMSNVQRFKNTKDYDIDSSADTSILNPVISLSNDCNLKKENMLHVETTTEKNEVPNCIDANTSDLKVSIPTHYSTEILDTLPSPSETIAEENQLIDPTENQLQDDSSIQNLQNLPEIITEPKPEHTTENTFDNSKPTGVQDTTNNLSVEKNSEEGDKYIPEIVCTTEKSKSEISNFFSVSTQDPITMNTDIFNFPINQNEEQNMYSIDAESNNPKGESESIYNHLDKGKENNINTFPNIREGLIKTFENVKKINEKWQDKIKLDVQDALQLVNVKNNVVMQEEPKQNPVYIPEILAVPEKSKAKTSNNPLSSNELQKMSDSILSLSSINQNSDPNLRSSFKEVQEMDSSGEPSETISCLTPAEVYNRNSEEKPLNNNNKKIIKSGSENQQNFRNLNTGMTYKDIEDKHRKSETPLEKSSLKIKEPSSVRFDENEMAAEASEPKAQRNTKIGLDNSRYLKQDYVVQPNNELDEFGKSLLNVNNFFDNVKSTISNVFSKTNENIFKQTEDYEDNFKLNKQDRGLDLKPKLNLKKSSKFLTAPEAIQSDTHSIEKYKPNLNPYRARVPVPKSFDVKPILTFDETSDKKSRTLSNPRNILPKTYSTNTFVDNSNENVGNGNFRPLFRESVNNNPQSESTALSPNIYQNNFRSSAKKIGSLKDRTNVALQNFPKTLSSPLWTVLSKENNRYRDKNVGNENLFETMASKRNEWNEKLKAINLDLNDRLSLLSNGMADSILPSLNSQPQRISAKCRSDVKNKPVSNYFRRVNAPSGIKSALPKSQLRQSNDNLPVSKALKKSLISDHLSDLKPARLYENSMSQKHTLVKPATKNPKTETKTFKPNFKILSVTTTIRPETVFSELKPPQTIKKVSKLIPKIAAPSLEKNPFALRRKSGEPHTLGSENVMSRVLLDKKTDIDKSAVDVASDESDQKLENNFRDIKTLEQGDRINVALSKLRETFKGKILNRDSNKKDSEGNSLKLSANTDEEIISSASENVNKEIDGSLKENVQYKCKMLCTKDK